jgi:heme exporter protein C
MKLRYIAVLAVAALIFFAGYAALFIAPDEKTMHAIQRIFYFHVPSAISAFIAFFVVFIANAAYLVTRQPKWDWLGVAGAEVGVACCTVVLITGPIWARPVWGIWWTWDARLTSTFILWLLYITYLLLRGLLEDPQRRATLSAIFGIFAFLDVPLVYLSNRLWRTQHPQPVILGGENSGLAPGMGKVLLLCWIAVVCVMIILMLDRYRLERLRHEYDELCFEVESRSSDAQSIGKER